MNEQVLQLFRQAGGTVSVSEDAILTYTDHFDPAKFAELIVRECIDTIVRDTANYPGEGMMAYYQGVQDAGKSIKQHFGVEK